MQGVDIKGVPPTALASTYITHLGEMGTEDNRGKLEALVQSMDTPFSQNAAGFIYGFNSLKDCIQSLCLQDRSKTFHEFWWMLTLVQLAILVDVYVIFFFRIGHPSYLVQGNAKGSIGEKKETNYCSNCSNL